jgi:hypothetical protein
MMPWAGGLPSGAAALETAGLLSDSRRSVAGGDQPMCAAPAQGGQPLLRGVHVEVEVETLDLPPLQAPSYAAALLAGGAGGRRPARSPARRARWARYSSTGSDFAGPRSRSLRARAGSAPLRGSPSIPPTRTRTPALRRHRARHPPGIVQRRRSPPHPRLMPSTSSTTRARSIPRSPPDVLLRLRVCAPHRPGTRPGPCGDLVPGVTAGRGRDAPARSWGEPRDVRSDRGGAGGWGWRLTLNQRHG